MPEAGSQANQYMDWFLDRVHRPEENPSFNRNGTAKYGSWTEEHSPDKVTASLKVGGKELLRAEGNGSNLTSLTIDGNPTIINDKTVKTAHSAFFNAKQDMRDGLEAGFRGHLGTAAGKNGFSNLTDFIARSRAPSLAGAIGRHVPMLGAAAVGLGTAVVGGTKAEAAQAMADATPGLRVLSAKQQGHTAEASIRGVGDSGWVLGPVGAAVTGAVEEGVRTINDTANLAGLGKKNVDPSIIGTGIETLAAGMQKGIDYVRGKPASILDVPDNRPPSQVCREGDVPNPMPPEATGRRSARPLNREMMRDTPSDASAAPANEAKTGGDATRPATSSQTPVASTARPMKMAQIPSMMPGMSPGL